MHWTDAIWIVADNVPITDSKKAARARERTFSLSMRFISLLGICFHICEVYCDEGFISNYLCVMSCWEIAYISRAYLKISWDNILCMRSLTICHQALHLYPSLCKMYSAYTGLTDLQSQLCLFVVLSWNMLKYCLRHLCWNSFLIAQQQFLHKQ